MAVKGVIWLWPEGRIIVGIEAVSMHDDFAVPKWRLEDVVLVRCCDKVFTIEKEGPHFAICHTNVSLEVDLVGMPVQTEDSTYCLQLETSSNWHQ
jgi:hypothetical protein